MRTTRTVKTNNQAKTSQGIVRQQIKQTTLKPIAYVLYNIITVTQYNDNDNEHNKNKHPNKHNNHDNDNNANTNTSTNTVIVLMITSHNNDINNANNTTDIIHM